MEKSYDSQVVETQTQRTVMELKVRSRMMSYVIFTLSKKLLRFVLLIIFYILLYLKFKLQLPPGYTWLIISHLMHTTGSAGG